MIEYSTEDAIKAVKEIIKFTDMSVAEVPCGNTKMIEIYPSPIGMFYGDAIKRIIQFADEHSMNYFMSDGAVEGHKYCMRVFW